MKYTHRILILFLLLAMSSQVWSQQNIEHYRGRNLKTMFIEAESYLLYEDYKDALYLFKLLNQKKERNYNIIYKMGVCHLYIPEKIDKAIELFNRAKRHIDPEADPGDYREISAPPEVYYYMGMAYRKSYELDSAIANYKRFMKIGDSEVFDFEIVKDEIRKCEQAKVIMQQPVEFTAHNLGEQINDAFPNIRPVISGDGQSMVFVSELKFYDAIFYTQKDEEGNWSKPVNIIPQIEVDDRIYPTSLSFDGKTLYMYYAEFGGDIFVSRLGEDGEWMPVEKLGRKINTKYWESHASISKDGKTLYFTSNRDGGFGGLDIYKATKNADGEWESVENLGPNVNSRYDEDCPYVSTEGDALYFSSLGHFNMGGMDVFRSIRTGSTWSKPQNLGYPINSTMDDMFYQPVSEKSAFYPIKKAEDNFGQEDIYEVHISQFFKSTQKSASK